jgi:2-polyprenyl-3-methyl-5-hydroxy-6-metoxy-1,4-benzoquinol methylase
LLNIKKLPYNITVHNWFSGIYFNLILKKIIFLIVLYKFKKILDFGCGFGYLKKKLVKKNENDSRVLSKSVVIPIILIFKISSAI